VVFAGAWWRWYASPTESPEVNAAELSLIQGGGGGEYSGRPLRFEWAHVRALLSHRQILGASLGQFGGNSTQVFFVTWFPTYLVKARGMTFLQAGSLTALPYIGASIGVLLGGWLSDSLLAAGRSANLARKLPIVGGLLLASTIVAANYVSPAHDSLVILVMSIAFFGQGMTNLGWTVVSDVAPKHLIGLAGGIFNFSANLAGILTPLVIGIAFEWTNSFVGPLIYIGVVALLGAVAYSVILGDIHRLDISVDDPLTSRPRVIR
jgi:ACS family D-galactonate transporter-like MFS transporter